MGPPDPARLAEADALVRKGELGPAAALIEAALDGRQAQAGHWLQLAGLRRALRQPRKALDAVHKALALAPLEFTALVMRADLLDRLSDADAGQAWEHALAQRPDGDLPPPLAQAVARGEAVRAAWMERRETALAEAAARAAPDADEDDARRIARFQSNVLRKTPVYRAEPTHYHYPGLAEWDFYPRHRFPWLVELEAATPLIRAELEAVMRSERAELVPYLQYAEHEPLAQWRALNRNPDWTAIHLLKEGRRIDANADLCPRTMEALSRIEQPRIPGASPVALFSMLAPNKIIPPHVGVNNTRLLCHLPLIVPEGGCWFRVGAETRYWKEGEAFVFDDTYEHEAANPTDHLRVVMIFDVWHPDLSETEKRAIAEVIGADGAASGGA